MTPSKARWLIAGVAVLLLAAAVLLWRFTPLANVATPERLAEWIGTFRQARWSAAAVIAIYVIGGLIMFPVMLLIAATAIVFDPLVALILSLAGSLANAAVLYALGARLTRGLVEKAFGNALRRVSAALENRGILAIAVIRTVPVAPFTVVNIAAGTIGVRFIDYMIGTALGLAPGLVMLTAFGAQLRSIFEDPTPSRLATIAGIVVAWLAVSLLLQRITMRRRSA